MTILAVLGKAFTGVKLNVYVVFSLSISDSWNKLCCYNFAGCLLVILVESREPW